MTVVPDDKDWTWVLHRPCPECGFDTRQPAREQIADLVRTSADSWRALLAERADADLRRRPDPATWSALEYACHVRDVFVLYLHRLDLMLECDDPLYPNWDQDVTAVEAGYSRQVPLRVSDELGAAAALLAGRFAELTPTAWSRPGRRSDGARFTVETFGRYLVHDPIHHLHDVGAALPPADR